MNSILYLIIFVSISSFLLWAEENPTISSGSSAPKPKAIPKALPVKSSTNKDADVNRKALRALPLVPSDPEVEVKPLRALPVNKDNEAVSYTHLTLPTKA